MQVVTARSQDWRRADEYAELRVAFEFLAVKRRSRAEGGLRIERVGDAKARLEANRVYEAAAGSRNLRTRGVSQGMS